MLTLYGCLYAGVINLPVHTVGCKHANILELFYAHFDK